MDQIYIYIYTIQGRFKGEVAIDAGRLDVEQFFPVRLAELHTVVMQPALEYPFSTRSCSGSMVEEFPVS